MESNPELQCSSQLSVTFGMVTLMRVTQVMFVFFYQCVLFYYSLGRDQSTNRGQRATRLPPASMFLTAYCFNLLQHDTVRNKIISLTLSVVAHMLNVSLTGVMTSITRDRKSIQCRDFDFTYISVSEKNCVQNFVIKSSDQDISDQFSFLIYFELHQ